MTESSPKISQVWPTILKGLVLDGRLVLVLVHFY